MRNLIHPLILILAGSAAQADDPEVQNISVEKMGSFWSINVTIEHADTGWDHFADGWEVLDADGNVLGYRKLLHPHVEEQPFTRSISNLILPDGTREIFIRTHCSVDGWTGTPVSFELSP